MHLKVDFCDIIIYLREKKILKNIQERIDLKEF